MTHRSRNGGPPKTHRKPKQKGAERRKLHHPPQPPPPGSAAGAASAAVAEAAPRSDHPVALSPSDSEVLALLRAALRDTIDSDEFIPTVQKIKGLLYDKKWLEVFEDPELLGAYAGRWVPSRVMCFRELFVSLASVRAALVGQVERSRVGAEEAETGEEEEDEDDGDEDEGDDDGNDEVERPASPGRTNGSEQQRADVPPAAKTTDTLDAGMASLDVSAGPSGGSAATSSHPTRVLSLGGGAGSEMLAFASILHGSDTIDRKGKGKALASPIAWTGADIGAWDGVLRTFGAALASQWSLGEERFQHDYIRTNLLDSLVAATSAHESSSAIAGAVVHARVITLLFTLTELFAQSRVMAVRVLRALTARTQPGALLLVADSASDISEFEIGTSGRKWPVYFILDTVLLGPAAAAASARRSAANDESDDEDDDEEDERDEDSDDEDGAAVKAKKVGTDWELLDESDSRWFRLAPTVAANWPVKLENTRYWFRLYRRR